MSRPPLQQLIALLAQSHSVLVTTRVDASVGSIASLLALGIVLERAGKTVTCVTDAQVPAHIHLPGKDRCLASLPPNGTTITIDTSTIPIAEVRYDTQPGSLRIILDSAEAIPTEAIVVQSSSPQFDVMIVIDSPDLLSLGSLFSNHTSLWYSTPVVVCDRSPQNEQFGQINLIDLTAASTIEIIDRIRDALEISATPDLQQLFLTALIADTDRFMESHTTPHAFSMAASLVESGIDHIGIIRDLYKTRELPYLQLLGRALTRVQVLASRSIAWTMITDGDLLETHASTEMIPLMIHEIAHLAPAADIVAVLHRTNDHVRVTIESTTPLLDARALASHLGPSTGSATTASVTVSSTDPREILERLSVPPLPL